MERLTGVISACDFTLIAVVIKGCAQGQVQQSDSPVSPGVAIRPGALAALFVEEKRYGKHHARSREARGAAEDAELELAFRRVCDGDNRGRRVFPFNLVIADKRTNSEGLQLADLTARPIGLSVVRKGQANRAYEVLEGKFFAGDYVRLHPRQRPQDLPVSQGAQKAEGLPRQAQKPSAGRDRATHLSDILHHGTPRWYRAGRESPLGVAPCARRRLQRAGPARWRAGAGTQRRQVRHSRCRSSFWTMPAWRTAPT